ncbi:MAG: MFS transporter [Rhodobacteraceae bacterium]|nr:MFS transporter [Paracoccaceae bacterium]
MWEFLTRNRRWLATGFLLALGSSFGQTYFISLFAGEIRAEYGLSDGDWGPIYTVATLASAALLLGRGSVADSVPLSRLAPSIAVGFAGAAALMALGWNVWTLLIAVFLLRFCGQGMFSHIKVIAMARWFVATRGRAMALTNLGYPAGEMTLPLLFIPLLALIGWRMSWGVVVALLLFVVLPLLVWLLREDRAPQGQAATTGGAGIDGRHWQRPEVLHHWAFWALIPFLLTPGFIGTVVFFHQVHVSEVKGWTLAAMAPGYIAYAAASVSTSFVAGWASDRFTPPALLPIAVLPMALGAVLIGTAVDPVGWFAALALTGISTGISATLGGTLLPFLYGTDHLGAIRAIATAVMVFSTAIGPGITGLVIDWGIAFPDQGVAMALWCVALSAGMALVAARLRRMALA